ncbi:unnamed protein product, partial [Arabidopsis halleri]
WQRFKTLFASPPSCSSLYWFRPRYQVLRGKHVSFLVENVQWIHANLQNAMSVFGKQICGKCKQESTEYYIVNCHCRR